MENHFDFVAKDVNNAQNDFHLKENFANCISIHKTFTKNQFIALSEDSSHRIQCDFWSYA